MRQCTAIEKEFRSVSQKIAEAIAAAVDIDVTIMNDRRIRIAGTGKYKDSLYQPIGLNSAFDHCLRSGGVRVVYQAGKDALCRDCAEAGACAEQAEICVPICWKGKVIGVIGIIAFDEIQRSRLLQKEAVYINFMQKMASLLEGKYGELSRREENKRLSWRMNRIVNSMQQAALIFHADGNVLFQNDEMDRLLSQGSQELRQNGRTQIWEEISSKLGSRQGNLKREEIRIEDRGKTRRFLADVVCLQESGPEEAGEREYLVMLADYDELQVTLIRQRKDSAMITFENILSVSECMRETKELAAAVAVSGSNILITGESGTGKELFARAIHSGSKRLNKAFVAINCGAIPDELLESELFGCEKGAFTGAVRSRVGKLEIADGGTIFLDEIAELPLRLQVKLLRVLQEKEICRLGSNETRRIDVRILSATNADLAERIQRGLFREDLYYRLNTIPIHLPPLRERGEDVECLTRYYIDYYNRQFGKRVEGLSEGAARLFQSYPWPGNVRELQNVLEYAICLTSDREITRELALKRLGYASRTAFAAKGVMEEAGSFAGSGFYSRSSEGPGLHGGSAADPGFYGRSAAGSGIHGRSAAGSGLHGGAAAEAKGLQAQPIEPSGIMGGALGESGLRREPAAICGGREETVHEAAPQTRFRGELGGMAEAAGGLTFHELELQLFAAAMEEHKTSPRKDRVALVCKALGISRATFYRRLKELKEPKERS